MRRSADSRIGSVLVSAGVYGAVALWFMGPALWHPRSLYAGYPDDPEQYMWYLGWFWHAVLRGQNPLVVQGALNYPYGLNLMWNTSILAEAALFGPLARLVNGMFAYNALFLANLLGICVLGEVLLRQLGVRPALARLGGLLAGILPYETAQSTGHISITILVPLLAIPSLLLAARRRGFRQPVLWGALTGLMAACQFYTSLEVLATATLAAVVFLLLALLLARREFLRLAAAVPRSLPLAALAVFLLLALPGLLVFLFGPYRPVGALQPKGVFVTDLLNPILPSQLYLLHTTATVDWVALFSGNTAESDGYLGIPALLLAWVAYRRGRQRPLVPILFWTAVLMTLLSFGPFLHVLGTYTAIPLPWLLLQKLPLLNSVLPVRLMLYSGLALAGMVILGAEEMLRSSRPPHWLWGALPLLVLTWLPALPYPHTVPPASGQALSSCGSVCRQLRGQPTYVLVGYFPPVMAALGDARYAFPVANVYGHSANSYPRKKDLLALTAVFQAHPPSPAAYQRTLRSVLPRLQVRRLLYLSLGQTGILQPRYQRAISAVLGSPIARERGALVWRVPAGLTR